VEENFMGHQHKSQTKNTIASSQSQTNTIARSSTHPIEELQGAIGNRAVNQLLAKQPIVQAKPMFRGLSHELQSPTPIQAKSSDVAKTGIPENLKTNMENAFNTDFSDVKIHEGPEPLSIGALAYTQGNHIYFAPGQYNPASQKGQELLGHELTHFVQQKQGRVAGSTTQGLSINTDSNLEMEADRAGTKASRGESVQLVDTSLGARSQSVIQPKLGFELELLVLVDVNGRPAREKIPLGTVGPHLHLTADQNKQVEANTPSLSATVGNYQSPWFNDQDGNPQDINLGDYDIPQGSGWQKVWVYMQNNSIISRYNSLANANLAHPAPLVNGASIEEMYYHAANDKYGRHPTNDIGMGKDQYASILEIVTNAYEPETVTGSAKILDAMRDAVAFAGTINPHVRTALYTLPNVTARSTSIYIGNNNSLNQTVDASIQTTLGLDIAQLASFISSAIGYNTQGIFLTKHDSDIFNQYGQLEYTARKEIPKSIKDATEIINTIGHDSGSKFFRTLQTSSLVNLRGLIALMCQYLRLGKYAYGDGRWNLDKNITPLLSRTDLAQIYRNLPNDEKTWLSRHQKAVRRAIYAKTDRQKYSTVFTDNTQGQRYPHIAVEVQEFINNVFQNNSDGITSKLGGFHKIKAENIDPHGLRPGSEKNKVGPVFELRNLVPGDQALGDRFPPATWVKLAYYFADVLATLNDRNDADAQKDTKLLSNAQTGAFTGSVTQNPW
jgi:Domain of unknown function (DUF4157)